MTDQDFKTKMKELLSEAHICMLTTVAKDGAMHSRPMAVQQTEDDSNLWFFAYEDSSKVEHLRDNPKVNVAVSGQTHGAWVSVAGSGQVVHDKEKAKSLWSKPLDAWFEDGLDTPGLTLICVEAESGEFWDTPGSRISTAFSFAKAKATGKTASDIGENEAGEL